MNLRNWNPIRGLSISRVVSAEESAQRGDFVDLQWLYQKVEKKDAVIRGAKKRLSSSVLKLDWDIKIKADLEGEDLELAERQKAFLAERYDAIENMREALKFLVLAEFRGFAHLERGYEKIDGQWMVTSLDPVKQWHWCRDGIYGDWCYNAEARMGGRGVPVDIKNGFLVREEDDPINEIALKCFILKNFAQKDWANFAEKFGVPFIYWLLSEGVAQSLVNDPDKLTQWQSLMDQISGDRTGIFPGGDLKTLTAGSGQGATPFKEFIEDLNAEAVLAATAGKLTMLNDTTGLGSGQSESHQDTFDELALALAAEINEVFNAQFDRPLLTEAFPGQRRLAYFALPTKDGDDVDKLVEHAAALKDSPYAIEPTEFSEKSGYTLSQNPDDEPTNDEPTPAKIKNRGKSIEQVEKFNRSAKALANDLAPAREILTKLLDAEDDELVLAAATALDAFDAQAETLLENGGELAEEIERLIATEMVEAASDRQEEIQKAMKAEDAL